MLTRNVIAAFVAAILTTSVFAAAPAPSRDQARFEVRFLTMMIDHHYGAVKMAELCDGRTIHPELQAMCDTIETTQLAEIAEMQQWLQDWYGVTHEPMLSRKTQRELDQLAALTGAEFERHFMLMMIEHHSMAIMEGLECLKRAYHAEMINMCAMMVGMQADEIAQMRLWLCQWYSICELPKHHRM